MNQKDAPVKVFPDQAIKLSFIYMRYVKSQAKWDPFINILFLFFVST